MGTVDTSLPVDWSPAGSEAEDCYTKCGGVNGKCQTDFCGAGGLCCSQKAGFDGKGACPKGMGGKTHHTCVSSCVDQEPGDLGFPWTSSCAAYGVVPGSSKKEGGKGSYCDSHAAFRKHCPRSCGTCKPDGGCKDKEPGDAGFSLGSATCGVLVSPGCSKKDGGNGCYCDTNANVRKNCPFSCNTNFCAKDAKW